MDSQPAGRWLPLVRTKGHNLRHYGPDVSLFIPPHRLLQAGHELVGLRDINRVGIVPPAVRDQQIRRAAFNNGCHVLDAEGRELHWGTKPDAFAPDATTAADTL